ncbi:MAG: LysE family transporter [Chitinophagaceae bacterium]|nr:LysE family transporter [Chitinophagaceae bacterium]
MQYIKIFFTGLFISFLGTLPLGTLNVAALQISVSDGVTPALYFSIGALTVEMIYVRLSLVAMDWVRKNEKFFKWLEWATVVVVLALAISSFIAAGKTSEGKNMILSNTLPRFWLGVVMSSISPMQIPFWFGWSAVLFSKKVLLPRKDHYWAYIFGIGTGTFTGNLVFIYGGYLMIDWVNAHNATMNIIIGSIFVLTAIIQLYRIFKKA